MSFLQAIRRIEKIFENLYIDNFLCHSYTMFDKKSCHFDKLLSKKISKHHPYRL